MNKMKRPKDINQLAKFIVDKATGSEEVPETQKKPEVKTKKSKTKTGS